MPEHYNILNPRATYIKDTLLMIFLVGLAVGSIYYFYNFQPKRLTSLTEVKGTRTKKIDDLPLPDNSEIISTTTSNTSAQLTFRTKLEPEEIETFYENILLEKDWQVESEFITQDSLVSKYKKGDFYTTITASQFENQPTIASYEITPR